MTAPFATLCSELHEQLKQRMRTNVAGQKFMPRQVPYEFFDHKVDAIRALFESAGTAERHITQAYVDSIVGFETASKRREDCATTILTILLAVHSILPLTPSCYAWQKFQAYLLDDPDRDTLFKDKYLPFSRQVLRQGFGEAHGLLFFACQFDYCSPLIEKSTKLEIKSRLTSVPLPYLHEEHIGSGSYGEVYKVKIERGHVLSIASDGQSRFYSNAPEIYARKDVRIRHDKQKAEFGEWQVFRLLQEERNRHKSQPSIMRTFACIQSPTTISLFMDWAVHGDLDQFMRSNDRPLYPDTLSYFDKMCNIAGALAYLHHDVVDDNDQEVACYHLDLKPQNILVTGSRTSPTFKLSDFSISRIKGKLTPHVVDLQKHYALRQTDTNTDVTSQQVAMSTVSRVGDASTCIAPEALGQGKVTEKSDIWGFGCVMSIFITWLCRGQDGPPDFAKQRLQQSGDRDDRFFVKNQDVQQAMKPGVSEYNVNLALSSWFNDLCHQSGIVKERQVYDQTCDFLLKEVLQIAPDARPSMPKVLERFRSIRQGTHVSETPRKLSPPTPPSETHSYRAEPSTGRQHVVSSDNIQTVTSRGFDPSQLTYTKHPYAEADVLSVPISQFGSQTTQAQNAASSGAPISNIVELSASWQTSELKSVRKVLKGWDSRYIALLHTTAVTLLKVSDTISTAQRVLVTYRGERLREAAMGYRHLCLIPENETFKLCFFELASLFGDLPPTPQASTVQCTFMQPLACALHPERSVVACHFRETKQGPNLLHVFELSGLPDRNAVRSFLRFYPWETAFRSLESRLGDLAFTSQGQLLYLDTRVPGQTLGKVYLWRISGFFPNEPAEVFGGSKFTSPGLMSTVSDYYRYGILMFRNEDLVEWHSDEKYDLLQRGLLMGCGPLLPTDYCLATSSFEQSWIEQSWIFYFALVKGITIEIWEASSDPSAPRSKWDLCYFGSAQLASDLVQGFKKWSLIPCGYPAQRKEILLFADDMNNLIVKKESSRIQATKQLRSS